MATPTPPPASASSAPDAGDLLQRLRSGILELTGSERWRAHLDWLRRFHSYSFGNVVLIRLQRPDATWVAGFGTWRRLGHRVRRGERAISILAPILAPGRPRPKLEGEEVEILGFRAARVFDVAQTSGPGPVELVARLEGEDPERGLERLWALAQGLGFEPAWADFDDQRNGQTEFSPPRILIRRDLSPAQSLKTMAHELAHARLHQGFQGPRALAELEAESVAYMVCAEFGLDSGQYSFGYLSLWAEDGGAAVEAIAASGRRIRAAAAAIIAGAGPRGAEGTSSPRRPLKIGEPVGSGRLAGVQEQGRDQVVPHLGMGQGADAGDELGIQSLDVRPVDLDQIARGVAQVELDDAAREQVEMVTEGDIVEATELLRPPVDAFKVVHTQSQVLVFGHPLGALKEVELEIADPHPAHRESEVRCRQLLQAEELTVEVDRQRQIDGADTDVV